MCLRGDLRSPRLTACATSLRIAPAQACHIGAEAHFWDRTRWQLKKPKGKPKPFAIRGLIQAAVDAACTGGMCVQNGVYNSSSVDPAVYTREALAALRKVGARVPARSNARMQHPVPCTLRPIAGVCGTPVDADCAVTCERAVRRRISRLNGGIDGQNDAAHVRFEKTPTGMCDSVQYPSRVACALGASGNHLRVLGLLREPVARILSMRNSDCGKRCDRNLDKLVEDELNTLHAAGPSCRRLTSGVMFASLADAHARWFACMKSLATVTGGVCRTRHHGLIRGMYAPALYHWMRYFPRDHVQLSFFNELFAADADEKDRAWSSVVQFIEDGAQERFDALMTGRTGGDARSGEGRVGFARDGPVPPSRGARTARALRDIEVPHANAEHVVAYEQERSIDCRLRARLEAIYAPFDALLPALSRAPDADEVRGPRGGRKRPGAHSFAHARRPTDARAGQRWHEPLTHAAQFCAAVAHRWEYSPIRC